MNENTEKLIRELADKLGTTAEHLWGVLIKQAWISGVSDLAAITVWSLLLAWSFKIVKRKTTVPPKTEDDRYPCSEWDEQIPWTIWWGALILVVLIVGMCSSEIITSLANPEYWALKQVIGRK